MAKRIKALELNLTAEEEASAERIYEAVLEQAKQQVRNMARLLASKSSRPHEMLGKGEFELRSLALQLGANVLEAGVNDGSKKGVPRS